MRFVRHAEQRILNAVFTLERLRARKTPED